MKREIITPILLGFIAKEIPFWCGEEDTFEGFYANVKKGMRDHEFVFKKVVEEREQEAT